MNSVQHYKLNEKTFNNVGFVFHFVALVVNACLDSLIIVYDILSHTQVITDNCLRPVVDQRAPQQLTTDTVILTYLLTIIHRSPGSTLFQTFHHRRPSFSGTHYQTQSFRHQHCGRSSTN